MFCCVVLLPAPPLHQSNYGPQAVAALPGSRRACSGRMAAPAVLPPPQANITTKVKKSSSKAGRGGLTGGPGGCGGGGLGGGEGGEGGLGGGVGGAGPAGAYGGEGGGRGPAGGEGDPPSACSSSLRLPPTGGEGEGGGGGEREVL